jgi:hypothetical protein
MREWLHVSWVYGGEGTSGWIYLATWYRRLSPYWRNSAISLAERIYGQHAAILRTARCETFQALQSVNEVVTSKRGIRERKC